ncbi:MAG: hypothetical protein OES24_06830, partial [Acidimicrobiia bacterium]|nr:hypothetical protein [Acidimicrobiia bacterium]
MIAQLDRADRRAVSGVGDNVRLGNLGLALAVVAALCGLVGGRLVESAQVDGLGLLRALPTLYWAGVVLGVVSTFALLRVAAGNESGRYAAAVPILWLLLLHTAPQLAHAHPRFPTAWSHVGLLGLIDETGTADVTVDPRLGWPGVHGVFMAPMARLDGRLLEGLLRLWPTFITGATTILVAALGRRSYPTIPLIGSLSALMYVLLVWTGQDYFSPQSIGLLWFVGILVLLESGPLETGAAWSGMVPVLPRFSASGGDRPASRSTPAFVALIILSFGAVVSHPMAPLFVCVALFLLGLYGRSLAWRLLVLVGPAYLVWFVVSGQPWWGDGIGELMRPFAGLLDETAAELSASAPSASPDHQFVTRARLIFTLATLGSVVLIGTAMSGERLRHLRPAVPLVPLVAVPVLLVAFGGYGGASMIHAIWFTAPFASILAGRILASLRVRSLPVIAAIVTALLSPLLLVTRFGGERFEFTTAPDRAAILAAYDSADADTLFVADSAFVPWRDRGVGENAFTTIAVEPSEAWIEMVESEAAAAGKERIVVVLTNGQIG